MSLGFSDLQTDIPANVSYEVLDDGDGKNNTLKIVVTIQPVIEQGAPSAFGSGKTCEIVFSDVVYHRENEKELLASGQWKFVIELAKADSRRAGAAGFAGIHEGLGQSYRRVGIGRDGRN